MVMVDNENSKAEIQGVVTAEVKTLSKVFSKGNRLEIPSYQRPYKWNRENVRQLWLDLKKAFEEDKKASEEDKKRSYRLGTIVIHCEQSQTGENPQIPKHYIVDGQQRLITLVLLLQVLKIESGLEVDYSGLLEHSFEADISCFNISENHRFLRECVGGLDQKKEFGNYLLNQCEFVCIVLNSLSQAFQFFDSQNARGKPLAAYDLLKAFHLREMRKDTDQTTLLKYISNWEGAVENVQEDKAKDGKPILAKIINTLLFRLRKIHRNEKDFFDFTTDQLGIFKGLNAADKYKGKYPYLTAMSGYCFQICQVFFNGEDFFKYIEYYRTQYKQLFDELIKTPRSKKEKKEGETKEESWYSFINDSAINRLTGDKNLRDFFELSILFYYDKFGKEGLENALHKAFVNTYQIRLLTPSQVRMGENNIDLLLKFIHYIDCAQQPSDLDLFTIDSTAIKEKIGKDSYLQKLKDKTSSEQFKTKDETGSKNSETNTERSFNYIVKYFKEKSLV